MNEIWKDVNGYEGLYKISNLGRVKSLGNKTTQKKEVILRPHNLRRGYKNVALYKNGIKKEVSIHRLVAEAFIPNPYNKPYIDHINTVTDDNRVENLRWCTPKENANNKRTLKKKSESVKGDKNPMYGKKGILAPAYGKHLTEEHKRKISIAKKGKITNYGKTLMKKIDQYDINGNFIKTWESISNIEKELGILGTHISRVCKGKRKTTGGYIFKYHK